MPKCKMSDAAIDLIVYSEITSPTVYNKLYSHPEWPGGNSGVTVGIGYDLGMNTAAAITADWSPYLDSATVSRLARCAGIHGLAARDKRAEVASVTVPYSAARQQFAERTLPRYQDLTEKALPNIEALPPDSYGALVSLVFNRGAGGFILPGPRYDEMRTIKQCMIDKNFAAIPAAIRSMKRLWPTLPGLVTRRENEAKLFERGLATLSPPSA